MNRLKLFTTMVVFTLLCAFSTLGLSSDSNNKTSIISNSYSTIISWVTDKPSTSQIEYGIDGSYSQASEEDTNLVIYHKVILSSLNPSTTYNYRIKSKDTYGHESVSRELTFITKSQPLDDQPPEISDIEASSIVGAGPAETVQTVSPVQKRPVKQVVNKRVVENQTVNNQSSEEDSSQMIKKQEPIKKVLTEQKGILLRKGKWQVEPSFSYAHTSANKIAVSGYTVLPVLVIGEISNERVNRDIFTQSVSTRYGITNNLQAELVTSYRYELDRISVASPASETTRSGAGLGDMFFGLTRQIAHESGLMPDLIAGLYTRMPTGREPYNHDMGFGTGHWGIKPTLVAVKSSDPAILFSSLAYTYNISRSGIENYGTVKPGDSIDYSIGAAFAVNYQLAFNFQLQESLTQSMRMNNSKVPGSFTNSANLKYGLTWSVSKNSACEVAVTNGLTTDSPDFTVTVSVPISF